METNNIPNPFWFGMVKGALRVSRQQAINDWGKRVGYDNALMDDCVMVVKGWKAMQPDSDESHPS